jgi:plastocyanin domain-containing protein
MRLLLVLAPALALALAAAGCDKKADPAAPDAAPVAAAGQTSIPITVDGDGFKPSSVKFKKGAPATLVFTRTTDETCATEVVFPQLDIKKELPKGKAVAITIPTDKEQTLTFQCGMGMYKSSVIIAVE